MKNLSLAGIFSLLIVQSFVSSIAKSDECSMSDAYKIDCGVVGITSDECEQKGCCWVESSGSNVPWCFYKSGDPAASSCFTLQSSMKSPFSSSEIDDMRSYFLKNINIDDKGGVVAAPDQETPGGSYYYHWMRDGALTMRSLLETSANFTEIEPIFKSYVQFVIKTGSEEDPNDQDILTEPKFNLPNGDVFTDPWCRPQNDGPGLQGIALIKFANILMKNGEEDYVKEYLWTGSDSKNGGGAIKMNLDYVINGYDSNTCDLWEEIRSTDFFWNRVTMKYSMELGAAFATTMGDSSSAQVYSTTASKISSKLYSGHWNDAGFIFEDVSRTKDSAVIVGLNSGYNEDTDADSFLSPTSYEVASTVASYNILFCTEYAINTKDTTSKLPGVLYGRYGGDSYAGGNPWVLSTAALAQLFYRGGIHILRNGVPDSKAILKWAEALNVSGELPTKKSDLAKIFAAAGDSVLLRLREHVETDKFHLDEQIDRNTGEQMSAEDLTWSYAEVLNAMHQRDIFVNTM